MAPKAKGMMVSSTQAGMPEKALLAYSNSEATKRPPCQATTADTAAVKRPVPAVTAARTRAGALISVAGGGDTVAALNQAGVADDFSYISTAGGAFLEWMEGKTLPGVAALEQ